MEEPKENDSTIRVSDKVKSQLKAIRSYEDNMNEVVQNVIWVYRGKKKVQEIEEE